MCLTLEVASTLGTQSIPFTDILPSTCCLYPKDKHRLGASFPAAAISGTPSGFPVACTPCVCLPGHTGSSSGSMFTGYHWDGTRVRKPSFTDRARLCTSYLAKGGRGNYREEGTGVYSPALP